MSRFRTDKLSLVLTTFFSVREALSEAPWEEGKGYRDLASLVYEKSNPVCHSSNTCIVGRFPEDPQSSVVTA